ncbi:hypothetical protein HYH03_018504 [Edaphochlamys debaryana]|uniref:J domain-containing protein n=1 Tax=Edaphochlamys debaryana TaxID=47281 RepID=A0A835XFW6_9CHLO|nr:hypothetical protein HYH03_018504 [Edaphochlamys debaryana]|eukprot:KAG2482580.1 hypothetical protein HYH03_018504 [Edaphochlamys debaryana]
MPGSACDAPPQATSSRTGAPWLGGTWAGAGPAPRGRGATTTRGPAEDSAAGIPAGPSSAAAGSWAGRCRGAGDTGGGGRSHYEVLGVAFGSSQEDVRKAFHAAARAAHPDKGGSAEAFAAVQSAWEALRDPGRRAAYDVYGLDEQRRTVQTDERDRTRGGEAALLAELGLVARGPVLPACQLVVTCGGCGRPATRTCCVCGGPFCSFCARRQHWRGAHPPHWPLVAAPGSLAAALGRREFEAKRLEDDRRWEGARLAAADPHHRSEAQRRELRAFAQAAALAEADPGAPRRYAPALARLYMWTQTHAHVIIAVHLPNGRHDAEVEACVGGGGVLTVGARGAQPALRRALAGPLEPGAPLELTRTADGRFAVLTLAKAQAGAAAPALDSGRPSPAAGGSPGTAGRGATEAVRLTGAEAWLRHCGRGDGGGGWWRRLFVGDSDGARCVPPPYTLSQTADELLLELPLPWWVRAEDVEVQVGPVGLQLGVRGLGLGLARSYWSSPDDAATPGQEAAASPGGRSAVVPERCSWSLGEGEGGGRGAAAGGGRRPPRLLSVALALPDPSPEEVQYKRGVGQDHRQAARGESGGSGGWGPGGSGPEGRRGVRFFAEDEDAFGLEPLLQAACFRLAGGAWVLPPPWEHEEPQAGRWVDREALLPPGARAHLARLRAADQQQQKQQGPLLPDGEAGAAAHPPPGELARAG